LDAARCDLDSVPKNGDTVLVENSYFLVGLIDNDPSIVDFDRKLMIAQDTSSLWLSNDFVWSAARR
jgi:hypothetical protein